MVSMGELIEKLEDLEGRIDDDADKKLVKDAVAVIKDILMNLQELRKRLRDVISVASGL